MRKNSQILRERKNLEKTLIKSAKFEEILFFIQRLDFQIWFDNIKKEKKTYTKRKISALNKNINFKAEAEALITLPKLWINEQTTNIFPTLNGSEINILTQWQFGIL